MFTLRSMAECIVFIEEASNVAFIIDGPTCSDTEIG